MAAIWWTFESESVMSSTATHWIEGEDSAELNEAVTGHVSKETEGGDQRTPALSVQTRRKNELIFVSAAGTLPQTLLVWFVFKRRHPYLPCYSNSMPPSSSPDKQRHTADVFSLGSERWRDWSLGFRQRNPNISSSQGPAVVGPVPTHAHLVAVVESII